MAQAIRRKDVAATWRRRERRNKIIANVLNVVFGIGLISSALFLIIMAPELLAVLLQEAGQ